MDSSERDFTTLAHQTPDRIPIDYWARSEVSAMLRKKYGFSTQEELLEYFDVDFRYIEGPAYIGPEFKILPDGSKEDHFGLSRLAVSYVEGKNGGIYLEDARYLLQHAMSVYEIENYPQWLDPDYFDYECVHEQARLAREKGKVVVFMRDRLNRIADFYAEYCARTL